MPWYNAFGLGRRPKPGPELSMAARAQAFAAQQIRGPETKFLPKTVDWQNEVWGFYDTLGEFNYAVTWLSNMISRVRLRAAELKPGQDEPTIVDSGPAADLMDRLAGGVPGQAQMMAALSVQLSIPGEGFLVGERTGRAEDWTVRSVDEVRVQSGKYQVVESRLPGIEWRDLSPDSLVTRVWRPHKRYYHVADSSARSARATMKELDLVNRHIVAQYLSRLASAGIVILPEEVQFPVREEFEDSVDPFMSEWIEIAAEAIRQPGTASAVIPMPMRMPAEFIGKVQHLDFTLKLDEKIIEKREAAIKRLATQVNIPAEVLLGMGDVNHWCTLDSVRIMTRAGWKTYTELVLGEDVLTLNHETGLSEWQPLLSVNTWEVADEPMVTITGRRHSSTTTLNHRWPVLSGEAGRRGRAWTTTAELMEGAEAAGDDAQRQEYLVLAAPSSDLPADPKFQDALVELVAWYFTEGSVGVRPGRNAPKIRIYQSPVANPDNCARIRRALTNLFGAESEKLDKGGRYSTPESVARRAEARSLRKEHPRMPNAEIGRRLGVSSQMVGKYLSQDAKTPDSVPRWREQARDGGRMSAFVLNAAAGQVILDHAPGRLVSLDFVQQLTATQLELFIDTAIRGDGHLSGGVTPVFGQKDPAMCDAFELACILSGRSVNRYEHTSQGISADGPRMKTQHMVTATHRSVTFAPRGRSFERDAYTGTIWCPTTPNGSWLAEDNGHVFFTGNSAWQLEEGAIKTNIVPDVELICDALTKGYLQPRLTASGETDVSRWVVWYDTSELTLRPDRTGNAVQLYDRLELSGSALRREGGFSEDDKPTDEELEEQGLKVIVHTLPSAAPGALAQLVGEEPPAPTSEGPPEPAEAAVPEPPAQGPPEEPATGSAQATAARRERLLRQSRLTHAIRIGMGGTWELLHPQGCAGHAYSCPFTHATWNLSDRARPGTSGVYECRLDTFGQPVIGPMTPHLDTAEFLTTRGSNHARA